jgi:hypothetical protein
MLFCIAQFKEGMPKKPQARDFAFPRWLPWCPIQAKHCAMFAINSKTFVEEAGPPYRLATTVYH